MQKLSWLLDECKPTSWNAMSLKVMLKLINSHNEDSNFLQCINGIQLDSRLLLWEMRWCSSQFLVWTFWTSLDTFHLVLRPQNLREMWTPIGNLLHTSTMNNATCYLLRLTVSIVRLTCWFIFSYWCGASTSLSLTFATASAACCLTYSSLVAVNLDRSSIASIRRGWRSSASSFHTAWEGPRMHESKHRRQMKTRQRGARFKIWMDSKCPKKNNESNCPKKNNESNYPISKLGIPFLLLHCPNSSWLSADLDIYLAIYRALERAQSWWTWVVLLWRQISDVADVMTSTGTYEIASQWTLVVTTFQVMQYTTQQKVKAQLSNY